MGFYEITDKQKAASYASIRNGIDNVNYGNKKKRFRKTKASYVNVNKGKALFSKAKK